MDEDRNTGVTEARFALTIVICLLVAIGYVVLARLGSSSEAPIEVRQDPTPGPQIRVDDDDQPQVLTVDGSEDSITRPPKIAERSIFTPPPVTSDIIPAAGSSEYQR